MRRYLGEKGNHVKDDVLTVNEAKERNTKVF